MMIFATHPIFVFYQRVVEATNRDQEQYDLYVVKDMNPLFSFRPLTANIEHAICEVTGLEYGLADTSGP